MTTHPSPLTTLAYLAGRKARRACVIGCPFPEGHSFRASWLSGWDAEDHERRQRRIRLAADRQARREVYLREVGRV